MPSALIVDDVEENRYLLEVLLAANGYTVASAPNGADALVLAGASTPDLIVTDLLMPVMDGFTFCRICRSTPQLADIPIVVYTATYTDPDDETLALNQGADLFIVKPLDIEDLMRAIGGLMARHRAGLLARPSSPDRPEIFMRQYNAALIRKLEDKLTELDASQRKLRAIFESASQGIITLSPDGAIGAVNGAIERMFGYDRAEITGQQLEMLLPERLRKRHELHRSRFFSQPSVRPMGSGMELTGLRKDGSEFPLEVGLSYIQDGHTIEAIGLVRDITARRRQEEASRRLAAIVDSCQDAIFAHTPDGVITSWNPGAASMLGYSAAGMEGTSLYRLIPSGLRSQLEEIFNRVSRGERVDPFETELRTRDGERLIVSLSATAILDRDGNITGISSIARDITVQRRLEDGLRQIQKMETVGQLAGGIAHDFNNLLTVITGYAADMLRRLDSNDPLHRAASQIQAAGQRAGTLTRQLLAFSRRQFLNPRVLNINTVVRSVEQMLSRLIRADVHLKLLLDPSLNLVEADPHQIEQVLMNLVVNASDAMPDGGVLTIETANVHAGPATVEAMPGLCPGPHAVLIVRDTGIGMEPEVASRVFEPFFTTKGPGKGTGLGLATVFGIVTQSGGHVAVASSPGSGSSFSVYLPVTGKAAVVTRVEPDVPAVGGHETILLVEDNDDVRSFVSEVLRDLGYKVHEARDAASALRIAADNSDTVDLVITDLVMPGMGGRELADRLMPSLKRRRILFMSGYADDNSSLSGDPGASYGFLGKPFDPELLAGKVRGMLAL